MGSDAVSEDRRPVRHSLMRSSSAKVADRYLDVASVRLDLHTRLVFGGDNSHSASITCLP